MLTLKNKKSLQYKFLFVLSTAYLAVDINMQGFLALMPFVRDEFALNSSQAGLYSTFYFLLATLAAVFSGRIVDKIGSKTGLVVGTAMIGILMFFHTRAGSFALILFLALLIGLFFSIITPSLNKAVMKKTEAENRATSMGLMQMGGGIGGLTGAVFLPFLSENFGWRNAVLFSAAAALLVSIFILLFFKEKANGSPKKSEQKKANISFIKALKILFKNKTLLIVCLFGLILGFNSGSIPAHYTLYLTQDIQLSRTTAGIAFGLLQIGGILGRPLWGILNDKILAGNRSSGLIIVGFSLTLTTFYYAKFINLNSASIEMIYFSSLILGFVSLGWLGLYFTTIIELASEKLAGIGTGLSLVFVRLGVLLSPPIFGLAADFNNNYQLSWLGLSLLTLAAAILFAFRVKNR